MERKDDQELWDLLGHSPEPKTSPFFARNVVRAVRADAGQGNLRRWFSVRRLVPTASVAVALIAVLFLQRETPLVGNEAEMDLYSNVDPQDYELVSDLNDMLGSEDRANSVEETVLR